MRPSLKVISEILRINPLHPIVVARQTSRTYGSAAYVLARDATSKRELMANESKMELVEFNKLLPSIIQDLTQVTGYEVKEANEWIAKVLQESTHGSNRETGLSLVESYKILKPGDSNLTKVRLLGWCLEILRTSAQMREECQRNIIKGKSKDKTDYNTKLLESSAFLLLKQYFHDHPLYDFIIDQFHETMGKITMGQALNQECKEDKTYKHFTMERYTAVTRYRTSYINFKMPVTLAMAAAGIDDQEVFRQAKTILLEMGNFCQAQMDINNCYGCKKPFIEPGLDIEEGNLTWPAVVALQRVSPEQKKIFIECYGVSDEDKSRVIRELYSLVGIKTTFNRFRQHNFELLFTQIQQVSRGLNHKMFLRLLFSIPCFSD